MFVSCSKISISVTAKHVQNIGIIRAFSLPMGTKKFAALWADTMVSCNSTRIGDELIRLTMEIMLQ